MALAYDWLECPLLSELFMRPGADMALWRRWKAKHWDEVDHPLECGDWYIRPPHTETPRFRQAVRRLIEQCEHRPLEALAVLVGLFGTVVGLIALIL